MWRPGAALGGMFPLRELQPGQSPMPCSGSGRWESSAPLYLPREGVRLGQQPCDCSKVG